MRKKNRAGVITHPGVKLYYKAKVIKILWYWHKVRYINQWNRISSPKINPCIYDQLIFDKGIKNIQWGERIVSEIDDVGKTGYPYAKKMKSDPYLTKLTKINSN